MKRIEVAFYCNRECGEKCLRLGECKSLDRIDEQGMTSIDNSLPGFYICPKLVIKVVK
jgi:hypothetical protein